MPVPSYSPRYLAETTVEAWHSPRVCLGPGLLFEGLPLGEYLSAGAVELTIGQARGSPLATEQRVPQQDSDLMLDCSIQYSKFD